MKRKNIVNEVKKAKEGVVNALGGIKGNLSGADATALAEMLSIADEHATSISQEELAVVEAGVGAKPMSVHC